MMRALVVAWAILQYTSASPLRGQVTLDDRGICTSCTIRFEVVATITGDRVAGEPRSIVRTRAGRYLVTFWPASNEILEFGPDGSFMKVFAATGEGPGEVSSVGHMGLASGDTLQVYDRGRIQYFTTDGRLIRTELLPIAAVSNAARLAGDRSVVNTGAFTRDGEGLPLRLVQGNEIVRAFGTQASGVGPTTPFLMIRSLTSNLRDRIWSAPLSAYEIYEWNSEGQRVAAWTRDVPWFRSWTVRAQVTPDAPPDPRLVDLEWLGGDRLLVLTRIASRDWRDYLGEPTPGPGGRTTYPEVDYQHIFATRLELIDLDAGTVLLQSDELDSAMLILDQSYLVGYTEDAIGNPEITIWRVEITGL